MCQKCIQIKFFNATEENTRWFKQMERYPV